MYLEGVCLCVAMKSRIRNRRSRALPSSGLFPVARINHSPVALSTLSVVDGVPVPWYFARFPAFDAKPGGAMQYTGETAALATAFLWTLSTLFFSSAGRRVGSLSVNLIRLAMAGVFFAVYGLLFRGQAFPTDAPASAWLWLSVSGFVGFFLGDLCLFKAFLLVGPRLSTLLMSLAPPLAAGVGYFVLEERLTPMNWLGMLVTLGGVCWVVLERQIDENGLPLHVSPGGVVLGLLAATGQAVGLVLGKLGMGAENYDAFASTQIRVLPALVAFAVLLGFLRWYPRVMDVLRKPRVMGLIALGSFTGPFLGVALLLLAVQYIETGIAQTFAAIIPVLIIPFVIVIYKERVSWRAVLGACVAVVGVGLLFWK